MRKDILHQFKPSIRSLAVLLSMSVLLALLVVIPAPRQAQADLTSCGATDVGGTVFRDYNANGVQEVTEPGFGDQYQPDTVTVTAYGPDNAVVGGPITLDADGDYVFPNVGGPVRIEITGVPSYLQPGVHDPAGDGSMTTVLFVEPGDCSADIGLNNPNDFCGSDGATLGVTCFAFGDHLDNAADPAFVVVPEGASGNGLNTYPGGTTVGELGATYGVAHQRGTGNWYIGAYSKRHIDYGPSGDPGTIYVATPTGASTLTTLAAGPNLHGPLPSTAAVTDQGDFFYDLQPGWPAAHPDGDPDWDEGIFDAVGKIGLGDIELNPMDNSTLYVVNLFDRSLYSIDTATGAELRTAQPIPGPGCSGGTDDWRPFGLGWNDGTLYVGGVCSGQTNSLQSEISAAVFAYDPVAATFSPAPVFTIDASGFVDNGCPQVASCNDAGPVVPTYFPWASDFSEFVDHYPGGIKTRVQPMLTDIEFDNGDLLLGFRDRGADQLGRNSGGTDATDATLYTVWGGSGDLWRACHDGAGGWVLEDAGSCGGYTPPSPVGPIGSANGDPANAIPAGVPMGTANNQGPGGGEYYWSDNLPWTPADYPLTSGRERHSEITFGGLTQIAGRDWVVSNAFDLTTTWEGGFAFFNHVDGSSNRRYRIFGNTAVGKAQGLGDIEAACAFAPVEIGNRVWLDTDGNGIQDPDETPIAGVTVNLYDGSGTVVATAVTSAAGQYTFIEANAPNASGGTDQGVVSTGTFTPGEPYVIRLDNPDDYAAGGPLEGLAATVPDYAGADYLGDDIATGGANNDLHDSDGIVGDTLALGSNFAEAAVVHLADTDGDGIGDTVTTGVGPAGDNDHTFDFGFLQAQRIGNLVWFDANDDGLYDPTDNESPIEGVRVELWADEDGSGTFEPATDTLVNATDTDAQGKYWFDQLLDGDYFVVIPVDQALAADPAALNGMFPSTPSFPDPTTDHNNNGDPGTDAHHVSAMIALRLADAQPTLETDPVTGDDEAEANLAGTYHVDNNSNLTFDFGFWQELRLGNLVWHDANNNGEADPGEQPIPGVVVDLYLDDGDGAFDPTLDSSIDSQTTDANGNYWFGGLGAGDHWVVIADGQAALDGFHSSDGRATTDPDDSIDDVDDGDPDEATNSASQAAIVTLVLGGEDIAEGGDFEDPTTGAAEAAANAGPTGNYFDRSSNLTVDFGFYQLSLGNQVFLDIDDDGAFEPADGESGIAGVWVELWLDADGDGAPDDIDGDGDTNEDPDDMVAMATTDTNGHYLFTGLNADTYLVSIPAIEWAAGGPLEGWRSSTGVTDADTDVDNTDDGIDPAALGDTVWSDPVTLQADTEPPAEDPDNDPNTPDLNENLTVDFGFTSLTLGNRVWIDDELIGGQPDGIHNAAAELPVAGVTVELWASDGVAPTGAAPLATDVTDADGYYLFTELDAGDYVVRIPASNFETGAPLFGYETTPGNDINGFGGGDAPDPDDDVDLDDAGNTPATAGGDVDSDPVTLLHATEPTDDDDIPDATHDAPVDQNANVSVDFGFLASTDLTLGNLVFGDNDNDGVYEPADGETGLPGVTVELYRDSNDDGVADSPTAFLSTVTGADGSYLFNGLPADTYLVSIPATEFGAGSPLEGWLSSTGNDPAPDPDDDVDRDDNGIEPAAVGDAVWSGSVTLSAYLEPTDEQDVPDPSHDLPADNHANLTVDFGFYRLSLGNQVFVDIDNDGVYEPADGETGIADIWVELWLDADGDGVPDDVDGDTDTNEDPDDMVAMATTDADGLYLFTGLAENTYLVSIPAIEWDAGGPLEGWQSSTGVTDADTDVDNSDDGIDPAAPGETVWSNPIVLAANTEPPSEDPDNDPNTPDLNENLTVDFGFTSLTLGNRVWIDDELIDGLPDGIHNPAAESPVAGVTVELWASDGVAPTGATPLATDVTNADGYYLFTQLDAGDYVVRIPASNFETGAPLFGYETTPGNDINGFGGGDAPDPDDDVDLDDAGNSPAVEGGDVDSDPVTLAHATEPTDDDDIPDATHDAPVDQNANVSVDFGFLATTDLSLGNMVFSDFDNDGVYEPTDGETGLPGVTVELYQDSDDDGVADSPTPLQTTVTGADGSYLFSGIPADTYLVSIPTTEFGAGSPLEGWLSSTGNDPAPDPDDDVDRDDNGIEPAAVGDAIWSDPVTLEAYLEPTDEQDVPDTSHDEPADNHANLTVDFGFYRLSLGNMVWADYNNDGLIDDTEPGIADIWVELWLDADGDGVPDDVDGDGDTNEDPDDMVAMATTDTDGHYLFTGLTENTYLVSIPAIEWDAGGPLEGWQSSTGVTDADTDVDNADDGIDPATPGETVWSDPIVLSLTGEPTAEDPDNDPATADGNENLTVDFGFWPEAGVGDFVWLDDDRDGLQDPTESGVAGVTVELIDPATGDVLATTETDSAGYYAFASLPPGDYQVHFDLSTLPDDHLVTTADPGDPTLDSDGDPTTGLTPARTVEAGVFEQTWDLGIHPREVDLAIDMSTESSTITAGAEVAWILTVTNEGPDPAVGPVEVTDTLPAGTTFVSATGNGWTCTETNGTVTCVHPDGIESGASTPPLRIVTATSDTLTGALQNTATVVAGAADANATNDSGDATVTIEQPAVSRLAFTGATTVAMVLLGLLLAAAGFILLAGRRFRLNQD